GRRRAGGKGRRGPRQLRRAAKRGKDPQGSPPRPQAKDQQRHLRTPASRRPPGGSGPGRATGERLSRRRDWLTPRTPALRTSHSRTRPPPYARPRHRRAPQAEETPPDPLTKQTGLEMYTTRATRHL